MQAISRRRFLELSMQVTLAGALAAVAGAPAGVPARPASPLAVAHGADYGDLLERALEVLGGASSLARPGERIVLKPTAAWNRPPALAANTHPLLVQALARLCLDAGAREVIVFDRTSFRAEICYQKCGLMAALRALHSSRVRLVVLTAADLVPSADGIGLLCRHALDADRLVNVPQAKHHARRGLALGAANLLGAVGGGQPLRDEFLVWSLLQLRPALTVLDASRLLLRNGPAGGNLADVERRDTLVASTDPLAVDAYGCSLFGRDWRELGYLPLAARAGLGQPELHPERVREV